MVELGPSEGGGQPLTRIFMEQLFGALREDFATLKQEIAAEVKDLKREVADLGQCVETLEQTHDTHEEKLDCHRRELLTLQYKNQGLQYKLEDLDNRLSCSNIHIKGILPQAVTGTLEDFVVRLFCHLAPDLKEQNIVLGRKHRAGRPARSPGQAQDILTCLHFYKQRDSIMAAVCDQMLIEFEGHWISLFQDLLMLKLQLRRAVQPVKYFLREKSLRTKWGHHFRLYFVWQNETHSISTLEEAQRLAGMPPHLGDQTQQLASQVQPPRADSRCSKTHT
ncbi:hypothetical protein NDU88_006356 [Pleurodeles waltl]|uniref:Uncharacterized protein n=1 Tax=Pleurodeles waltl TaxID=8319 RepID=A0AAV7TD77_PLEWA|nr:hypothetical protein NDU88_006356 [Pleurodeles waltl]